MNFSNKNKKPQVFEMSSNTMWVHIKVLIPLEAFVFYKWN